MATNAIVAVKSFLSSCDHENFLITSFANFYSCNPGYFRQGMPGRLAVFLAVKEANKAKLKTCLTKNEVTLIDRKEVYRLTLLQIKVA